MRKKIFGIGFLVLAAWVLLQGTFGIPLIRFNFWPLLGVIFFGYYALENLQERDYTSALVLGVIALIIADNFYDFLPISTGTLILAAVLAAIGFGMIFRPRKIWKIKNKEGLEGFSSGKDGITFGSGSRYINSEDFVYDRVSCSFGSAAIYFDNARIVGESATFDVEVSFGTVTLYVPSSWQVELEVDNAFGTVSNPCNVNSKDKTLYVKGEVAFSSLKIIYI